MFFNKIDARQYALLRILMSFFWLATLLGLIDESTFYYSNQGWFPLSKALEITASREWTLLHAVTSPFGVHLFFAVWMTAALGMLVGYRTRLCSVLSFIGIVSLHSRNWLNTYGGDAVLRLMLFYLALCPSGLAWSIDSLIARFK